MRATAAFTVFFCDVGPILQSSHLLRINSHGSRTQAPPQAPCCPKLMEAGQGTYAPRPSTGPHKLREALPLVVCIPFGLALPSFGKVDL